MPWRRERLPTPIFLPRQFHGQRSLAGYHLRDHKESGHDWATFASLHWHPLPYMKRHPKITSHFRSKWTGLYTHRHHQQVVKKTSPYNPVIKKEEAQNLVSLGHSVLTQKGNYRDISKQNLQSKQSYFLKIIIYFTIMRTAFIVLEFSR